MIVKTYNQEVVNFIEHLEKPTGAKLTRTITLLQTFGASLSMPHSKKIANNLYELRVRGRQEVRVLYAFHHDCAVLLHGFVKKTDKIPIKEIQTAKTRLQQLTEV